jgi:hypothetical protein
MATITITVTVAGGKFVLDGVSQATYSATPGNTYKFDQSDGTNGTHPLRLSTTSDGTHNSGSAYTDGVTTNGTPGSAGAYTQIVVDATTVQSLFYYCSNHSGMGGAFNVGSSATVQYQERAGFAVQNRTTDPVPYAQALADNPYAGTWASGGSLNTARYTLGAAGTATASLAIGGGTPPSYPTTVTNIVESYNGSSWTEVGDLNQARYWLAGLGTSTAALAVGGDSPNYANNEIWNGSGWTEVGDLNTGRGGLGAAGTTTAAVAYGGRSGDAVTVTETWNGSAWTEVNDLNTARITFAFWGTQTSAIAGGGYNPGDPDVQNTELWDGSSWTESGDLPTTCVALKGFGADKTEGYAFGGTPPSSAVTTTLNWDGSAWGTANSMATSRSDGAGSGNANASGLAIGGISGSTYRAQTEEFAFSGLPPSTPAADYSESIVGDIYYNSGTGTFKAISSGGAPIGSWASAAAANTARFGLGGAGTQNAALVFAGAGTSPPGAAVNKPQTEFWNGTAWTELNDMNQGRYLSAKTSFGTVYTAALAATGYTYTSPAQNIANVEVWNGSSWTEVNDVNSARRGAGAGGTSTSGVIGGGYTTTITNLVESWNGSSWTETTELNTGREDTGGVGTSNTNMQMHGGYLGPPGQSGATEQWNGSSWTEVADMNTGRSGAAGSGTLTLAIAAGGEPGPTAATEAWDGTSWTEVADLATARTKAASSATSGIASILVSGSAPPYSTATELWTAAEFQIKTVTTS